MKLPLLAAALVAALVAIPSPVYSQSETAVPFLLFPPSSEANGMGGTTIAIERTDPTASVFQPAQVGLAALTTNLRAGFYTTSTELPTAFIIQDFTYDAWSVSAGVCLNDFVDLPLRVGAGLAYHLVDFDLGTFAVTGPGGPGVIGQFDAEESASGVTIGVGVEYLLRFGFGYTFRTVESRLGVVGTAAPDMQMVAEACESAADYGFLLEAPIVSIVEEITGGPANLGDGFRPYFGLSAGMAWNNVGDKIVYIDEAQADPFPRAARVGIAVQGGIRWEKAANWEMLSAAWAQEAEDLLVIRSDDGTWKYQSGTGDIQFGTNVLQGDPSGNVGVRSGWHIQAAEVFTYRSGSVDGPSPEETRGYTLRLSGLLKGVAHFVGADAPGWLLFARDHVDVQYHSAEIEQEAPRTQSWSYSALTFVLRSWL